MSIHREHGDRPVMHVYCFGFRPWKHGYVRRYLALGGYTASFPLTRLKLRRRSPHASAIVVWGSGEDASLCGLAGRLGLPLWHMEDGFLRSVGLGSDRYAPASLVLDRQGIYYDPTRPSDLEALLEHGDFSDSELQRASALREGIVRSAVSKYNVGDRHASLPLIPEGRRVVLVPGQVEDDASILLGTVDVRTNAQLLAAARAARPDAFIIFKPHPDVVSGNRRGAVPEGRARALADAVIVDAPLPRCLALAHEVHTMTSLVGFEALLRGLEVTVYGLPFYAGWGLTSDRHVLARRTRRLTLDELVAGVLIRYPLYLHPTTGLASTPEDVVHSLAQRTHEQRNQTIRQMKLIRGLQKMRNAIRGMLDGR